MSLQSFARKAAEVASHAHSIADPLVIDREEFRHPQKDSLVYYYRVASAKHGNDRAVEIFLDEHGRPTEPIAEWRGKVESPPAKGRTAGFAPVLSVATIDPTSNDFTINPG